MVEKFFKSIWFGFWNIFEFTINFFITFISLLVSGYAGIQLVLVLNFGFWTSVFTVLGITIVGILLSDLWIRKCIKPFIPRNKKKKRRRDILNEWLNEES